MNCLRPTAPCLLLVGFVFCFSHGTARAGTEIQADETVDFSSYKTFVVEEGTPPRSERATREITAAVTGAVKKRGLRLVTADPDIIVRTHVLVDAHTLEELSDPSRWDFLTGVRSISAYDLGEGTLVIDFIDTASGKTIWRGLTTERLSGSAESTYKRIPKYVRKLVDRYPGK